MYVVMYVYICIKGMYIDAYIYTLHWLTYTFVLLSRGLSLIIIKVNLSYSIVYLLSSFIVLHFIHCNLLSLWIWIPVYLGYPTF